MTGLDDRDRQELRVLVERYARAADRRDGMQFAEVFTEDGILVVGEHEMSGRDELSRIPPRLSRYTVTVHVVTNHFVELVDADTATGEVLGTASHVHELEGVERVHVIHLRYDDRYRRVAGAWRIEQRRLVVLFEEDHPLQT